jgi:hypothetical protein
MADNVAHRLAGTSEKGFWISVRGGSAQKDFPAGFAPGPLAVGVISIQLRGQDAQHLEAWSMTSMRTIVWFRQDLRIRDNPALAAAAVKGKVVPIFVLDEGTAPRLGGASAGGSITALRHFAPISESCTSPEGRQAMCFPLWLGDCKRQQCIGTVATNRQLSRGTRS